MKTIVGSQGNDPERTRRFAVAIPAAIAITALLVGLARCQPADRTVADQIPAHVTVVLERAAPTPQPTPKPTPPPTPPPAPPVHKTALRTERAGTIAPKPIGGAHAAQLLIPHAIVAKTYAAPKARGGSGTSAAAGTGEGTGSGDAEGSGDAGGGGTVNADAPCGYVDLLPFQSPDHSGSVTFEHVRATVAYPDGHKESQEFPYRFAYSDPADDPWSKVNLPNDKFPTRVQLPPPGANTARYADVIRYIIDHTRQNGLTTLQECPKPR